MTTQKSTCKAFDKSYFSSRMRLSWSYGFICFIITLACMPIPMMMNVNNLLDRVTRNPSLKVERELIESISEGFVFFWIFAFVVFAIIGGIIATDYMINRKKAYLYHSMPQKRGVHFSHSLISVFIWFLAAVAVNAVITVLVFAANGVASGAVIGAFLWSALRAVAYFALVLSLMALCASLSGQTLSQLSLLVAVCFLPICIYLAICYIVYYSTDYSSFYEVSKFFVYITPFYRLLMEYDYPYSALELVIMLVVSVGVSVASYFIYKHRKIESAGTPIVSYSVGEVFKYLILVPLTFFAGLLFKALGGGDGWLFFGFLFGAFVGLVFINLFLYRNPSKMFSSAKGFGVFLVAFLVFFILIGYNTFGHDRHIPNEKNIHQISVAMENGEYTFRDKETVAKIADYAEKMIKADTENRNNNTVDRNGWVHINITNNLGFVYQKRIPHCDFNSAQQFYSMLSLSDEYLDAHMSEAQALLDDDFKVWIELPVIGDYSYSVSVEGNAFVQAYLKDVQNPMREHSFHLSTVYYRNCTMRVYSADENVMAYLADKLGFDDASHMMRTFREFARLCVKEVTVSINDPYLTDYYEELEKAGYGDGYWENSNLYSKTYTGEQAYEIFCALTVNDRHHSYLTYPSLEPKYSVTVHYEMSKELYELYLKEYAPEHYEMYYDREMSYPSYNDNNMYTYRSYFSRDSVPGFVVTDFSVFAQ